MNPFLHVPTHSSSISLGAAGLCLTGALPVAAACIDLRLVLAIDSSGSIDAGEYRLQIEGYALALHDPRVIRAIATAGSVEIGVIFWADDGSPLVVLPPRRVDNGPGRNALTADLALSGRSLGGTTGIGRALDAAATMASEGNCAERLVIDVSGDGRESRKPRPERFISLWKARERVEALGITVNGLSVSSLDHGIGDYYRQELITGPDAFTIDVAEWEDFADAIRDKLEREIRPPQIALAN